MTSEVGDIKDIGAQLVLWRDHPPFKIVPIALSENRVYLVTDGRGEAFILRLHRPGYHTRGEILSELDWISALSRETDLLVPEPVCGGNGEWLQSLRLAREPAPRDAVLFRANPGELPDATDLRLPDIFVALGNAAALSHLHAIDWSKPGGFSRPEWSIAAMLGPNGLWGDWRAALGLDAADLAVLAKAEAKISAAFAEYGRGTNRFGLIHNDMRPSNFLWHENRLRLIDFDDCGFGWFVADFAAAISWFEDAEIVPDLFRKWCEGYCTRRNLSTADLAMFTPAIMARRMLLLAWSASRGETDLARANADEFLTRTLRLATRFLDGEPLC